MGECAACGRILDDEGAFCGWCGAPVPRGAVATEVETAERDRDWLSSVSGQQVLGAGLIAAAVLVLLFFIGNGGETDPPENGELTVEQHLRGLTISPIGPFQLRGSRFDHALAESYGALPPALSLEYGADSATVQVVIMVVPSPDDAARAVSAAEEFFVRELGYQQLEAGPRVAGDRQVGRYSLVGLPPTPAGLPPLRPHVSIWSHGSFLVLAEALPPYAEQFFRSAPY